MISKNVMICTKSITLGQFLKFVGIIDIGSYAKEYIFHNVVKVNGMIEKHRGKKLFVNDIVMINNDLLLKIVSK